MTVPRWTPSETQTKRETLILKRLTRTKKLFAFLYHHRLAIFDDAFQEELAAMYRQNGEGKVPVPPALLAMATLLQGYVGASDAEAVELTVVDLRWQLVLGTLGADKPAFSQGALQGFRKRMIAKDMDKRLLERTVEVARATAEYDAKKLPKQLRIAVDSRPLEGAGRVEDTVNLLGHAGRRLLDAAATLSGREVQDLADTLGLDVLLASSTKRGLDVDWTDRQQRLDAMEKLVSQIGGLEEWIRQELAGHVDEPPLADALETLGEILTQNLDPDPPDGGPEVGEGVAKDRRVSIRDKEMRHGRKSKSKSFTGFKSHLAVDLDDGLVLACAITPANIAESTALAPLAEDIGDEIDEWHFDRGYVSSPVLDERDVPPEKVLCKPWRGAKGRLGKDAFRFNFGKKTVICPTGTVVPLRLGKTVTFPESACGPCKRRKQCLGRDSGGPRTLSVAEDERRQVRFRKLVSTPDGRATLRERVGVEHRLAHHAQKQGRKARYLGVRDNVYDARRHAAVLNLETVQRLAA